MQQDVYLILARIALLLVAAKLFGEIAVRLKSPSVVGEIIAGILLGPEVLGWVKPEISIQTVATLGIMLLLFIAGLEMDLDLMRRVGLASFCVALSGVLVPMGMAIPVFMALGESLRAAIFIGAILTATSVGLTLRSLMDFGRFQTRVGTAIVTAAVIDDVIGIFVLTMVLAMNTGGSSSSVLYLAKMAGLVVAFFVLALGLGWSLGKVLTRWTSRLRVDEALLAIAVCVAVGLGWLAANFKVAQIAGAFVAGLILNRTPEREKISAKVNMVGYALFIPIFFAYIGVNAQLGALAQAGWPVLAFLGVAFASKVMGCGGAALLWFGPRDSLAIGVAMIPRAEVALVMAALGLQANIIDASVFAMTVVLILVSCITAPLLLKLSFQWADKSPLQLSSTGVLP